MERVCSVCGGEKKELFSSTYCPRCEGDEPTERTAVDDLGEYPDVESATAAFGMLTNTLPTSKLLMPGYVTVYFLSRNGLGGSCQVSFLRDRPVPASYVHYYATLAVLQ